MEADMATAWQTLEEAALTLGISSRTLHRRMAKGEFESRMESGRREVLTTIGEPLVAGGSQHTAVTSATSDISAPAEMSADAHLSANVQHTMLALHEDRIRRTDLA